MIRKILGNPVRWLGVCILGLGLFVMISGCIISGGGSPDKMDKLLDAMNNAMDDLKQ